MRVERVGSVMAPLVRYGNALEHVVDAEIRRRLGPPTEPLPPGRVPFEAIAEVEALSMGAAATIFGPPEARTLDERDMVAQADAPLGAAHLVELRARCRALVEPMGLQHAMLVVHYAQRHGASARAIAEILHGSFAWASWSPSYNQLVGTELVRRSARLIARARGQDVPPEEP